MKKEQQNTCPQSYKKLLGDDIIFSFSLISFMMANPKKKYKNIEELLYFASKDISVPELLEEQRTALIMFLFTRRIVKSYYGNHFKFNS